MPAARLLVVDDEPCIGVILVRLFRDFEVTVVDNGRRALEVLRTQQFHIILCDLMMPGMSGIELYGVLSETFHDMVDRVIFMTAGSFTPETHVFLQNVSNPRIEKPFTLARLERLVRDRLAELGHDTGQP